jgi:hypothetical protein
MITHQDIEQLATKLFNIFNDTKTESVYDNATRWKAVARHVLKQEIVTRMNDLMWSLDPNENMKNPNDPYWLVKQRIIELQTKLEELRGE